MTDAEIARKLEAVALLRRRMLEACDATTDCTPAVAIAATATLLAVMFEASIALGEREAARAVRSELADTSGTHGRGEREWPGVREEHGRLRVRMTPVTLEIPMMAYLVTAAGKRKRRAKVVLGVLLAVLVAVVAFN